METDYREPAAAMNEVQRLIADAEDLIASVAHLQGKDLAAVRAQAARALDAAKQVLAAGGRRAQRAAVGASSYVRERPWQTAGVAAVMLLAVGYLARRRD